MKRCGAKTRYGTPCQRYALKDKQNGRCRLHGGLSTGAKTKKGKVRQCAAKFKHGYYTQEAITQRQTIRQLLKEAKNYLTMAMDK